MTTDRFPYDVPSDQAFITMLSQARPGWRVNRFNTRFENFRHHPTETFPGRTFVDLTLLDFGVTTIFQYRRLDIGIALGAEIKVDVEGDVTSRKIVAELNKIELMQFSNIDVFENDKVLAKAGKSIRYRMRARPSSPVWYGETILEVTAIAPPAPANARLLEDGTPRLLEDGSYRLLEV
jgi:hypothetical protein